MLVSFAALAHAEGPAKNYPGVPSYEVSKAYQQYKVRVRSELSRLIYLCDRLGESDLQIKYDDYLYPANFAARVSRVFLAAHYKKEKAEDWITRWASGSVLTGKPIWVKFNDGNYYIAKDLLFEELQNLDAQVKKDQAEKR